MGAYYWHAPRRASGRMYVVIQTAYKPFYAALLLSDIQQIHVLYTYIIVAERRQACMSPVRVHTCLSALCKGSYMYMPVCTLQGLIHVHACLRSATNLLAVDCVDADHSYH